MKAIESQVGGSHYKDMAFQPIELIAALRCSFIQGCVIKYISRYKNKNGAQDIKKYIIKNKLTILQRKIITQAVYNNYIQVIQYCKELLQLEYPENV